MQYSCSTRTGTIKVIQTYSTNTDLVSETELNLVLETRLDVGARPQEIKDISFKTNFVTLILRALFEIGDVEYIDFRFKEEEWPNIKPSLQIFILQFTLRILVKYFCI